MKFKAICENHLYSKAYSKGKRAVTSALAVYVLPDYAAKRLAKSHPEKKTVPDPPFPDIDGSSQACRAARATFTRSVAPQKPISPAVRSTRHARGQRLQARYGERSNALSSRMRTRAKFVVFIIVFYTDFVKNNRSFSLSFQNRDFFTK